MRRVQWTSPIEYAFTDVYLHLRPYTVEAVFKWMLPSLLGNYVYVFEYDESVTGEIAEQDIVTVTQRITPLPVEAPVDIPALVAAHLESIKPVPVPVVVMEAKQETDPVFTEWLEATPKLSTFENDTQFITTTPEETDPLFNAWLATPPPVSTFVNDVPYLAHEEDPVFKAWLKKRPNLSNFTNDLRFMVDDGSGGGGGGLLVETDPIFTASPSFTITNADIANWNSGGPETDPLFTAWLSGPPLISTFTNDVPYLTTWGPELDPVFAAWLLTVNPANWNTAYGWGNHANAGYLTSVTPHPLLNTTHSDTVPGAVVKGDIIVANATPDWERLPANATATNKYLRSVSNGVPSWEAEADPVFSAWLIVTPPLYTLSGAFLLDQTTPQTVINGQPIFNLGLRSNKGLSSYDTAVITGSVTNASNYFESNVSATGNGIAIGNYVAVVDSTLDTYSVYSVYGSYYQATTAIPTGKVLTALTGLQTIATNLGAGTVTTLVGNNGAAYNSGTGVVTYASGLKVSVINNGGGSITTAYGLYIAGVQGTDAYGIYQLTNVKNLLYGELTLTNGAILSNLTASKIVFTSATKQLTSTGIGTSSQFIKGDGTLDSSTYLTSVTAHDVLSATHGDTLPAAVTQGALVVGNATPKWSSLVANATATNKYLRSVSGGIPSWETVPGTVSFGTTTKIPYMNAGGTDFLYGAGLTYDGTTLTSGPHTLNGLITSNLVSSIPAYSDVRTITTAAGGNIFKSFPTLTGSLTSSSHTTLFGADIGFQDQRTLVGSGTFSAVEAGGYGARISVSRNNLFTGTLTAYVLNGFLSNFGDTGVYNVPGSSVTKNSTWTYKAAGNQGSCNPTIDLGNAARTAKYTFYANDISFGFNPTVANCTFTLSAYGQRIVFTGSTAGTSTGWGSYLDISGFDNNWGYYNNSAAAHNLLGLDNVKTYFGTGVDASITYDGTNMVFNSREVGTGDFVFSGGNVGIGTTSPSEALHVVGNAFVSGGISSGVDGGNTPLYIRKDQNAGTVGYIVNNTAGANASAQMIVSSDTAGGFFGAFGSSFTPTPIYTDKFVVGLNSDATSLVLGAIGAAQYIQMFTGGTATTNERIRIDSAGNVGIGTDTPGEKLEVNGNIQLTADNNILKFGTGEDAHIYYDATNLVIDPKVVGTGYLSVLGDISVVKSTISGSQVVAYRAITALRTLDATDYFIDCNANTFVVTLPTAVSITGRVYIIKNTGTGIITVDTTSSQTIDGYSIMTLSATNAVITVISNGANWLVLSSS